MKQHEQASAKLKLAQTHIFLIVHIKPPRKKHIHTSTQHTHSNTHSHTHHIARPLYDFPNENNIWSRDFLFHLFGSIFRPNFSTLCYKRVGICVCISIFNFGFFSHQKKDSKKKKSKVVVYILYIPCMTMITYHIQMDGVCARACLISVYVRWIFLQ